MKVMRSWDSSGGTASKKNSLSMNTRRLRSTCIAQGILQKG
jgi:hypothetical protein